MNGWRIGNKLLGVLERAVGVGFSTFNHQPSTSFQLPYGTIIV